MPISLPPIATSGIVFVATGLVLIQLANELYLRKQIEVHGRRVDVLIHRTSVARRARKSLSLALDALLASYFILMAYEAGSILEKHQGMQVLEVLKIEGNPALFAFPVVVVFALISVRRYVHLKAHLPLSI